MRVGLGADREFLSHLRCLGCVWDVVPRLTPWANVCRAAGACGEEAAGPRWSAIDERREKERRREEKKRHEEKKKRREEEKKMRRREEEKRRRREEEKRREEKRRERREREREEGSFGCVPTKGVGTALPSGAQGEQDDRDEEE